MLQLISEADKNEIEYLQQLCLVSLKLMRENNQIQETVYNFLLKNAKSHFFFEKIYNLIDDCIKEYQLNEISLNKERLLESMLQLLQLFCEGHYANLQHYLRQ